jgi:hypothetical protein
MVDNYSINYGIVLSRANLEMIWVFLHDSMCICKWRPLASCLQCQLYFEPCLLPLSRRSVCIQSALLNTLIRSYGASEFRTLNGFQRKRNHSFAYKPASLQQLLKSSCFVIGKFRILSLFGGSIP